MMTILKKLVSIVVFTLGICQPFVAQKSSQCFTLKDISLKAGERIVGIDISVRAGAFIGVSGLPVGWTITLDNDPSWQTSLKADAKVGAATIGQQAVQEINLSIHKMEFGDLKFRITSKKRVHSKL